MDINKPFLECLEHFTLPSLIKGVAKTVFNVGTLDSQSSFLELVIGKVSEQIEMQNENKRAFIDDCIKSLFLEITESSNPSELLVSAKNILHLQPDTTKKFIKESLAKRTCPYRGRTWFTEFARAKVNAYAFDALVELGCDPMICDRASEGGGGVLHYGSEEFVKRAIEFGVPVNLGRDDSTNPIFSQITGRHTSTICLLINAGCDPFCKANSNTTPYPLAGVLPWRNADPEFTNTVLLCIADKLGKENLLAHISKLMEEEIVSKDSKSYVEKVVLMKEHEHEIAGKKRKPSSHI